MLNFIIANLQYRIDLKYKSSQTVMYYSLRAFYDIKGQLYIKSNKDQKNQRLSQYYQAFQIEIHRDQHHL